MPMRSKLAFAAIAGLVGFLVVAGLRSRPADPAVRLPQSVRLADLITREQAVTASLRRQAAQLRDQVDRLAAGASGRTDRSAASVHAASASAGLGVVRGPGLRVTLDDSALSRSPSGDVNDLVIHSQDVQAVVNALWHAGASAIAVNDQRLVVTSAVLCVGNTLLLDGTVHSPPYVVAAVAADPATFDADALVRRLRHDADQVHLGFSVERMASLEVGAYAGPVRVVFAAPAG